MPVPRNPFKTALRDGGRPQIGLWLNTGEPLLAELAGTAGYDWLVIDGEHGPNDLRSIMSQLQALSASPAEAVVRPPMGETWMIKQLLDVGARRSEEHTSELQSLMRISYAVFCLKKKTAY